MAVNGLLGYTSPSSSRVTGLASNMDTETLVKKAMQAATAKYEKVLQKRGIDEWKIDSYREVTSTLQSFYKEYFDITATKRLKSADTFASFAATYAATNSTDYVSITPGASAKAGTYSISKMTAATAASLSSTSSVTGDVLAIKIGDSFKKSDLTNTTISSANDNNIFVLTLNNVTKQIVLPDSGSNFDAAYMKNIQDAIDANFGSGKIIVGTDQNPPAPPNVPVIGSKLKFSTVRDTDTFSIGTAYNDGSSTIFSTKPTVGSPLILYAGNNKFELSINGGTPQTVTIPTGVYSDPQVLADAIQTAVPALPANTFTVKDGKVTYNSSVSIGQTKNGANAALGIDTSNMSNKVDLNAKIADIKGGFKTTLNANGTGNDIEFTINNQYFRFNSKETSINDIIKKVNANTQINATMKYDVTTNSFKVQSRGTGATDKLTVEDKTGNFMEVLGIVDVGTKIKTDAGTDASVTIKNGSEAEITIVRPTNVFTYDGLSFDIKKDFTATDTTVLPLPTTVIDPIKVTVTSDSTKTYDFIKGFVDKYNEIIGKLNDKISEKKHKDYVPLTSDQESSMTEEQIKKWETKAKSGLLKNDSIISDTLSKLRSSLYAAVEGTGVTLSSIGITTSSNYEDKGKLVINETKLKEALASKSEEVATLFTGNSDITYYDAINSTSTSLRSQRYKECGIAQRFSDIIQDAIRTNTDAGNNKGTLLEKAGIVGDRSEYKSLLAKEILQYDDDAYEMNKKLIAKENALYKKYAAMESALNKLNSQQSNLTQLLGQ